MIPIYLGFITKRNFLFCFFYVPSLLLASPHALVIGLDATIVVNQAGYLPDWPKRAILINKPKVSILKLRDDDNDSSGVSEGPLRKVLFIGNSFTYYNNSLHYHVEQLRRSTMSTKAFAPYNFRAATIAGGYWYEQLANVDHLTQGKAWDAVVLQGHSREAIDDDKQVIFRESLKESRDLLLQRGVKPFLFMTWAYQHAPDMIKPLELRYQALAEELQLSLVPVGSAFHQSLSLRPEIKLHARDGIHPSRAGTYLAACVFYGVLYKEPSLGLTYDMGLPQEVVAFLQKVADETVNSSALNLDKSHIVNTKDYSD